MQRGKYPGAVVEPGVGLHQAVFQPRLAPGRVRLALVELHDARARPVSAEHRVKAAVELLTSLVIVHLAVLQMDVIALVRVNRALLLSMYNGTGCISINEVSSATVDDQVLYRMFNVNDQRLPIYSKINEVSAKLANLGTYKFVLCNASCSVGLANNLVPI